MYPKLKELDITKLTYAEQTVSYLGHKFYLNSGLMECHGITDGHIIARIAPQVYHRVAELDQWLQKIADGNNYPLIQNDHLKILLGERVRVFDSNGVKIQFESWQGLLANKFTACFLLEMYKIVQYHGKMLWVICCCQIRVKCYCTLPPGCIIYDNVNSFRECFKKCVPGITGGTVTEDAVVQTSDINELLD